MRTEQIYFNRNCSSSSRNAIDKFTKWRQFKCRPLIRQIYRLIDYKQCLNFSHLTRQREGERENHDVQIRKKSMVKRQFKLNFLIMHYFARVVAFTASRWFFHHFMKLVSDSLLLCCDVAMAHSIPFRRKKDEESEKDNKIMPRRIIDEQKNAHNAFAAKLFVCCVKWCNRSNQRDSMMSMSIAQAKHRIFFSLFEIHICGCATVCVSDFEYWFGVVCKPLLYARRRTQQRCRFGIFRKGWRREKINCCLHEFHRKG